MLFNKRHDDVPMADTAIGAMEPRPFPQAARPQGTPARSVIYGWLLITGNLEGDGELQVDGRVRGDIRCTHLIVGKGADIEGNISADTVVVEGTVKGVIRGNRVVLKSGAHVVSEIFHKKLAIEEGADYDGQIHSSERPLGELAAAAAEMRTAIGSKRKPAEMPTEAAPAAPQAADYEAVVAEAAVAVGSARATGRNGKVSAQAQTELERLRTHLRD